MPVQACRARGHSQDPSWIRARSDVCSCFQETSTCRLSAITKCYAAIAGDLAGILGHKFEPALFLY